jgi:hypothetical protein
MFWLFVTFVLTLLFTAYFYSVKVVFAAAWKEELSDLTSNAEKALKRCVQLRESNDDVDFTIFIIPVRLEECNVPRDVGHLDGKPGE